MGKDAEDLSWDQIRERDQVLKCFTALSALGDPATVAEHIGELVEAFGAAIALLEAAHESLNNACDHYDPESMRASAERLKQIADFREIAALQGEKK